MALLLGAALSPLVVLAPAQAQTAATASAGLDDIVVTAQRRTENLQNVPLSVTAISAASLAKNDIRDLSRVEILTPGFSFGRSGSDARPAIRGVRTENVAASGDPSIGFYVDNIYQSRASQANVPFVDIQRVEILRGPQGTLYGRNTFGGNITLTAQAPTDTLGASFDGVYGSYNRRSLQGDVNVPIADGIAVRVAGLREKMDGYIKGIDNAHDIYSRDTSYARASIRIAPTGSSFEAILRYSYWLDKGTGGGAFGYRVGGVYLNPAKVGATNNNGSINTNGYDLYGTPTKINPKYTDGIADNGARDVGFPVIPGNLTYPGNVLLRQRVEQHQLSANIAYDFGPVVLKSITGYTSFNAFRNADNDFSPRATSVDSQDDALHTLSEEVQLASSGETRFSWILGGYYLHDNIYKADFYNVPEATGAGTNQINSIPLLKSFAGFGQASYWVMPEKLRVTGGVRYTSDQKTVQRLTGTVTNFVITDTPSINPLTGLPYPQLDLRFKKTTYRVNAEYYIAKPNMLYATISSGFRSGGFNSGTFTNPLIPAQFTPETVTAFEIGSKNRFLNNRLQVNVAAYYNNFSNLQVQNQFLVPNSVGGFTTTSAILNAGKAHAQGLEIEVIAEPVKSLNIAFSGTISGSKYTVYDNVPGPALYAGTGPNSDGTFSLRGNRVPYNAKYKGTALVSYDVDLGTAGKITPQATLLVSGGYFLTDFNRPLDYQGSFAKLDLRIGWTSAGDRFHVECFVNNVTDKVVLNRATFGSAGVNQNYDAPRMFAVRFGAKI